LFNKLWLFLLCLVACTPAIPAQTKIASLERGDFSSATLDQRYWEAALEEISSKDLPVDGLALSVNQTLIAEAYFSGYTANTPHDLRSATKSITSLLVGIATDQHLLALSDPITRFFPEYTAHSSWRETITVRNLLTMSSGLNCDDQTNTVGNEENMYRNADWLGFFFAIPRQQPPASEFHYCTAGVVILGEIVARVSQQSLPRFAQKYLFNPLEIIEANWTNAPKGVTDAGGHIQLTPQSMLKIGMMVRDGGLWHGQRVVSATWLKTSLEPQVSPFPQAPNWKYGFLWWLVPVHDGVVYSYSAQGNGGQFIMVVPEVNLVVASTGHAYNSPEADAAVFGLMQKYLIPMAQRKPF
jgi:CubicO group peptidase (beta-lactamase class C family)